MIGGVGDVYKGQGVWWIKIKLMAHAIWRYCHRGDIVIVKNQIVA